MLVPPDRFLVLGHRGASAHARENTVEAFALAAQQGADGVELDVRRTADNQLVVHHDPTLSDGSTLVTRNLDEIRTVAPHVPTLEEAMTACVGLIVNVEIKNWSAEPDFDADERVAAATAEWLVGHGWENQVLVSSFNPQTIDVVKAEWPALATGQLVGTGVDPQETLAWVADRGHQSVNPNWSSIADAGTLVAGAHRHGLWVLPWTVDDPGVIRSLYEAGATGVFTNDPRGARRALQSSI